jgi:uncharacterized protein (DUF362 family)
MNLGNRVVSIIKCNNPGQGAIEAVSLLEAEGVFKSSPRVVFLKPNILIPIPFEQAPAEITAPRLIGSLIQYFYEHGAKKVIVGEHPVWGASCQDAYRTSGIEKVVKESGGLMCDLDTEPDVWVPIDGYVYKEMRFPRAMVEADLLVNIPKAKTHFYTGVTLGMKNLFGCIRYEDRKKFHRDVDIIYVLADILKAISPGLTVLDAVIAMEGFGPHVGTSVDLGLVIAGTDVVSVDTVGAYAMGFEPRDLGFLQVAEKLRLGSADIGKIRIIGEKVDKVRKKLLPPVFQFVNPHENVFIYGGGICVGCKARIPVVPYPWDPSKSYAVIIGREPIPMRSDMEADEIWLVGNCGIRAGMAYLLKKGFQGGFKKNVPRIVKIPGCPTLDWYSQKVAFPPLRSKGWMT